jgi:hypothetical protein
MQDHSHKLLFLGLTALMSAAAFYGSEAGPTLLIGNDAATPLAVSAALTPHDARASLDRTDLTKAPFAAKLTMEGTCSGAASDVSPLCPATSKISLSSP